MRLWTLLLAVTFCLAGGLPASSEALADAGQQVAASPEDPMAEAPAAAADTSAEEAVRWEAFEDPEFEPASAAAVDAISTPEPEATAPPAAPAGGEASSAGTNESFERPRAKAPIVLGPVGMDSQGRKGRIHTVSVGHTLWDISEAYLGTPWVWPSIWDENVRIANPHLIYPGDRIWITASEMRIISEEEAAEMIASAEPEPLPAPEPVAPAVQEEQLAEVPASLETLPVAVPSAPGKGSSATGGSVRVSWRQNMSFLSSQALEAATSIVDSPEGRTWLAQGDRIHLGLGEGDVAIGDHFTLFRDPIPIRDGAGGPLLGYHVDVLGWAEVVELNGDSSMARIELSVGEVVRGDLVAPLEKLPEEVALRRTPPGFEGGIVYMPSNRTAAGMSDYVYLNRGAIHGLEVGSQLEVYQGGGVRNDRVRGADVLTPADSVADLVVVSVQPDSAAAVVTHTVRELTVGDDVRAATERIAGR